MDHSIPTTSFGRRPATLGQIAMQIAVSRAVDQAGLPGSNAPAAVNKWQLFRTLTEIRERLGVSDRALSVLNALLSFHPEVALSLPRPAQELSGAGQDDDGPGALPCDLVVFPSNKALAARAHGMAERTLLRHLTDLIEAGLLIRRDSPNGKRYARKAGSSEGASAQAGTAGSRFSHAYGFDLTPLVARAGEFEALAEQVKTRHKQRYLTKERISLLRRDVTKLIALGLDEGLPGDWECLRLRAMALMTPLRRIRVDSALTALETDLAALREDITKLLESHIHAQNLAGNDRQDDAHQSNSKSQHSSELEPASKEEGLGIGEASNADSAAADEARSYPLGMVMEACPDVRDYGPSGQVRSWSDFLNAAGAVRSMIGISPDAWREAQEALGSVEAHIVVATILQRSIHSSEAGPGSGDGGIDILVNGSPAIRSCGGYLRALTEKARAGEFALGPVLMALIGQRLKVRRASKT
jgi:replication initiation protein RepC